MLNLGCLEFSEINMIFDDCVGNKVCTNKENTGKK